METLVPLLRKKSQYPAKTDARYAGAPRGAVEVDRRALARALNDKVQGEVRFGKEALALYATDASNYRQVPIGVVVPKTLEDVVATHEVCRQFDAPILSRGGGTSLSGETVNWAVVIDHSKYLRRVLEVNPVERYVHVENGAVNEQVNEECGKWGLIFPPDPSTHQYCTIGGNIGNNSCGIHSVQAQFYGHGPRTSDNVHSLEIVTYDGARFWVGVDEEDELEAIIAQGGRKGEIYAALRDLRDRYADLIRERYPSVSELPRRVSGYNLDELLPEKGFNVARALTGTEATCATVLTAKLLLTENTNFRTLMLIGFEDICRAADHVPQIMERRPIALEGIDHILFQDEQWQDMHPSELEKLPEGEAWLMVEFGGSSREEADEQAKDLIEAMMSSEDAPLGYSIVDDPDEEEQLWKVREAGLGATAFPPTEGKQQDHWPGWEDSAVPPDKMGDYLRELKSLYQRYDYEGAFYGHLGQGCLHSRINFDLKSREGLKKYRAFVEEAADLVVSYGGSLSGEHGDGQQRAELLEKQYGPELVEAMREFKRIFDPDWRMNPGKVVDAYRLDENLKLGVDYNPWRPKTKFHWTNDNDDVAHAMLRCVGVGRCRVPETYDVMCPSYAVTKEEMHTTRGRARLLFEMLQGDVIDDGWRSKEVYEALDLCLACKGCTSDCPVNVDMPTYKAEFLHHHWKGRLRPRYAYAFGLIDQAARLASRTPWLVNLLTQGPTAPVAKKLAGMAQERDIPAFAALTLQQWFKDRGGSKVEGEKVILWADTFNNYFHPQVGVAAVEALEAAGFEVVLPEGHVCCGRPLYDYGFLDLAKSYLARTIEQLRQEIRAGTPIVGLEPSCAATFKDELKKMVPFDDDAVRLSKQVYHLSEFLKEREVELPRLNGKAVLWGHCHHKATGGVDPEKDVLKKMGLEVEEAQGGCCGLAGSWGFEAGHYEISMQCGELGLLPAVREAAPTTVVVANGFSCKTQLEQSTVDRRALHLAEVIKLAREQGPDALAQGYPEKTLSNPKPEPPLRRRLGRAAALAVAGVAFGAGATLAVRRAM